MSLRLGFGCGCDVGSGLVFLLSLLGIESVSVAVDDGLMSETH